MQSGESSQSQAVSFHRKLTSQGVEWEAYINRIYEGDGVKFFRACCDLVFGKMGVLRERTWNSMSNDHLKVELQTTDDGKTRVAIDSSHMDVGYLVFSAFWFPIAYTGIWFVALWMLEVYTGRGSGAMITVALYFRGSAPLFGAALIFLGYKRHCAFVENGLKKLLAALQKYPAEMNLEEKDYNYMLKALPEPERALGIFRSYATDTADVRIKMDTPMHEIFLSSKGYLFRDYEDDVEINIVPRPADTLLVLRARPTYPLGILIGIFTALWISWTYFVGYRYVFKFGASSGATNLAVTGMFAAFILMLLTGLGILLFRKIRNDKAMPEAISKMKYRLESNQQGIFK